MIFLNPISIADMNLRLIASTDDNVDNLIWNGMTSTYARGIKTQDFFAGKYFTEYISNSDKYTFYKNDEIKYARMVSYIYNKNNVKVGLVSMYEYYTPFDEEMQEAFELFTAKISSELRNGRHFIKLGSAFHDDIFNKLRYAGRIKSYC